jgi:hypothetical protein
MIKRALAIAMVIMLATSGIASAAKVPSGTIDGYTGSLVYGGNITFQTTYTNTSWAYITVICEQDEIIYQWSASPDFTFPFIQQAGFAALGKFWDKTRSADCSATLINRIERGKNISLTFLDTVEFIVTP